MKEIELEELRGLQLAILDRVDEFCRARGIRYFLSDGTLLGAVRHKGFIPWDDDIDISMLRPDYERFVAEFNEAQPAGSPLRVVSLRQDPSFNVAFAKVEDVRTVEEQDCDCSVPIGVNIDIFPFDVVPQDPARRNQAVRKALALRKLVDFKKVRVEKRRSAFRNAVLVAGKTILRPLPVGKIQQQLDSLARSFTKEQSDFLYSFASAPRKMDACFPRQIFDGEVMVDFEGRRLPAIAGYHEYLSRQFGDYMTPPPPDKRISHGFKAWWK